LFLVLFALGYYIGYGPGDSRDVAGEVISFETTADNAGPDVRHFLHVRLDSGLTVRARTNPGITAKIGRRVRLIATKMPIVGIERYRFKEFLDSADKDNSLFEDKNTFAARASCRASPLVGIKSAASARPA
jgi:hypothetical protein